MNSLINKFNNARKNNQVLLLKNFMPNVPSWQDFINNIYNKANSEQLMQFKHGRNLNDIAIYKLNI